MLHFDLSVPKIIGTAAGFCTSRPVFLGTQRSEEAFKGTWGSADPFCGSQCPDACVGKVMLEYIDPVLLLPGCHVDGTGWV